MTKDLSKQNYIGRVVYTDDPDFSGRCKVRVFGLLDSKDEQGNYSIPDDMLPWFVPISSNIFSGSAGNGIGSGSLSVPKVGAVVRVRFANDDILSGEYTAIQNVDPNLADFVRDDYQGTHVLAYDSERDLAVVFQVNTGLRIYYQGSYIQITPDSMLTIAHQGMSSVIQMQDGKITIAGNSSVNISGANEVNVDGSTINLDGNTVTLGAGANQHAVLGEELVKVLRLLASEIAQKYPVTPSNPDPFQINSVLSNKVMIG